MKPGRKHNIDRNFLIQTLTKYKKELVKSENGTIVPKSAPIWLTISKELGQLIQPNSLHALACNKSKEVRYQLLSDQANCSIEKENSFENNSLNTSSELETDSKFTISISQNEFESLLNYKVKKNQTCLKFKDGGAWGDLLVHKIWSQTPITCGFNFKSHYITTDAASGSIKGNMGKTEESLITKPNSTEILDTYTGYCECGSTLSGRLTNHGNCVKIECNVSHGPGQCGKRNLRGAKRLEVANILRTKSAEMYRSEVAKSLMYPGRPEVPFLYSANVLHKAKHETIASEYLDSDPVNALGILKTTASNKNIIHGIGQNPFYVIYSTSHQMQVYKKMMKKGHVAVYIDASGVRIPKIRRPDGTLSQHIFLYHAVINCDAGQFSVAQFLSETHTSTYVRLWLMEWCRIGAPHPKEVVTDYSRALLTAAIKEFTGHANIEQYSDACRDTVPACYIRIDVAHFIKNYSIALKKYSGPVRSFYLAAIGQLVLCRTIEHAKLIFKALLVVSQCDTEGNIKGTETATECSTQQRYLERLITGKQPLFEQKDSSDQNDETVPELEAEESPRLNWWHNWAEDINAEAVPEGVPEEGSRANAYYAPQIASCLMRDSGK